MKQATNINVQNPKKMNISKEVIIGEHLHINGIRIGRVQQDCYLRKTNKSHRSKNDLQDNAQEIKFRTGKARTVFNKIITIKSHIISLEKKDETTEMLCLLLIIECLDTYKLLRLLRTGSVRNVALLKND